MEEPQRSIVEREFKLLRERWEASLDRTRANLAAGADPLDIIAAEGALLYGQEGMSAENTSFFIAGVMVIEAQRTPRQRGAAKKAVPAKRPRKKASPEPVLEGEVIADVERSDRTDI